MFEKAARKKLRYDTSVGSLSVEDLWDLPLTSKRGGANLDDIARHLHKQLKSGDDVSFVEPDRKSDETVQLAFDVVKHVIDTKLVENKAALEAKDRADKKQKILAIMADKQDESLKSMSLDDLQNLVAEM
jgi:uncharacterized protein YfeS